MNVHYFVQAGLVWSALAALRLASLLSLLLLALSWALQPESPLGAALLGARQGAEGQSAAAWSELDAVFHSSKSLLHSVLEHFASTAEDARPGEPPHPHKPPPPQARPPGSA